ncbi:MAG TPA: hypothetical protein VLR45_00020, partial [Desulfoprunum sp.]|nr:hypothetical protein [Desulfoprunum sp.]
MGIFSWFRKKDGPAAGTGPGVDTIDPGLMYCPQCHGEYRAGFVRCAACDIELVSGTLRLARSGGGNRRSAGPVPEITAEDTLISLRRGPLKDIKYLKKLLAAEGI